MKKSNLLALFLMKLPTASNRTWNKNPASHLLLFSFYPLSPIILVTLFQFLDLAKLPSVPT